MVNLYLLTKSGPTHFPVSPSIFGLFEPFLDFLEKMDQKLVRFDFFEVSGVKAFALTGRIADCYYTQGAALG